MIDLVGEVIYHANNYSGNMFSRVISCSSVENNIMLHIKHLTTGRITMIYYNPNVYIYKAIETNGKITNHNDSIFLHIDENDRPHSFHGKSNNFGNMPKYHIHGKGFATQEEWFAAIENEEDKMDAVFNLKKK